MEAECESQLQPPRVNKSTEDRKVVRGVRTWYVEKSHRDKRKKLKRRGTWEAQSVKHPSLDLGSGHDLTVREIEARVGLH